MSVRNMALRSLSEKGSSLMFGSTERELFSSDEESDEDERRERWRDKGSAADHPAEFWKILKLIKLIRCCDPSATVLCLCSLFEMDLKEEAVQMSILESGGLDMLINLLETDIIRCQMAALMILVGVCENAEVRYQVWLSGGLHVVISLLSHAAMEVQVMSAQAVAAIATFRKARRTFRHYGGIPKLMDLLDIDESICETPSSQLTLNKQRRIEVAVAGAVALAAVSKSSKNRDMIRKSGAISILARLLRSKHMQLMTPVVKTVVECSSEEIFRMAVQTENMVEPIVKFLQAGSEELQEVSSLAIFHCAELKSIRQIVAHYNGLDYLVSIVQNSKSNSSLVSAATGALWKCAICPKNASRCRELGLIKVLIHLLHAEEDVLVNVVGALGECAKDSHARVQIKDEGGMPLIINLLPGTNQALLVNLAKTIGECAKDSGCMSVMEEMDAIRLVWSLLKNPNPRVQASAAKSIIPCIENTTLDSADMIRLLVGAIYVVVNLLASTDIEVLTNSCKVISLIAKDEENLAIMTDLSVANLLTELLCQTDDDLRINLAEAIAMCASNASNRRKFANLKAALTLVAYLGTKNHLVHRATAKALFQLSKHPDNCVLMHQSGAVPYLMHMVGSTDSVLQEAASGCLNNIRKLALITEIATEMQMRNKYSREDRRSERKQRSEERKAREDSETDQTITSSIE